MKYSQLATKNGEAIASFYIKITEMCGNDSRQLTREGLRLLVLGNGAGVAIIATVLGIIIQRGEPIDNLPVPLVIFIIGTALAASVYLPLIAVATDTAKHIGESIEKVFRDELDLEHLQGYGFSKRGIVLVRVLLSLSIVSFIAGVALGVYALHVHG